LELWRLLAHNHWVTLNLYGIELRLCARCSGYLLGFTAPLLVSTLVADLSGSLGVRVQLLACFLLALPYAVDSGTLMGMGVFLFSRLDIVSRRTVFVNAALFIFVIGHLGKFMRAS
jgi:uncharacterized membrane protein